MTLKRKNLVTYKKLNTGISYRLIDDKLYDAQNVYNNNDITETRFGIKRFNTTSLGASVLSTSFFKSDDSTRYLLAKVGTVLYRVNASGAATSIKTGLTSTTKHVGITLDNRHIVAIESDGLFSYDGTTFTQLGQAAPTTGSVAIVAGGSLVGTNNYQVAITFYASGIGFETNAYESSIIATTADRTVRVSSIPATADNALIDKVRIYLKDVTAAGSYLFVTEQNLGTTTYDITAVPTSTQTPPTKHGEVQAGGGKYLTTFGKRIAYTGNDTYRSDVFISEEYLPDAYDDTTTSRTLSVEGQGPITGIASGTFSDSILDPYLVIFKKTSCTIYSELGGFPRQSLLDPHIGCISHNTIKVVNGIIYFMSENGWYRIYNGVLVKDDKNDPVPLGEGGIDDIFTRTGWEKELNKSLFSSFFSCVYSTHRQYWTFITEGSNSSFNKAYVYERDVQGFRTFYFNTAMTSACEGEDANGNQVVFLSDTTGTIFTYSVENELHDEDKDGNSQIIAAFILLPFVINEDIYSTYNYRFLTVRAIASSNVVSGKIFSNFNFSDRIDDTLTFTDPSSGFILDTDALDVGILGEERTVVTATIDINRTAETIMVGFYQSILDANMALISAQIQYNKNGGPNR